MANSDPALSFTGIGRIDGRRHDPTVLVISELTASFELGATLIQIPHHDARSIALRGGSRLRLPRLEYTSAGDHRPLHWWAPTPAVTHAAATTLARSIAAHWLDRGLEHFSPFQLDLLDDIHDGISRDTDSGTRLWVFPAGARRVVVP